MASQQQARKPALLTFPSLISRIIRYLFSGASSRVPIDGPSSSEGSKTGKYFGHRWKGLIKRRGRARAAIDILPDEVLLDIFDFYRMDFIYYPWKWRTLVHVCRRWRHAVFASPRRLDLQFFCTPRTPVRDLLEFLPPMPIMISNWGGTSSPCPSLGLEDGSQVISAISQRDRVCWVHLDGLESSLLETLVVMMQETFPTLTCLRLSSNDEAAPALPETFLGGSTPRLRTFRLHGIPFPDLPKLLLSTSNLIDLRLEKIPDSGYISPHAMASGLSTATKLEILIIDFRSVDPHPEPASQHPSSLSRVALPALTYFKFEGNGGYFDNFTTRIESPILVLDQSWHNNSPDRHVFYEVSYTRRPIWDAEPSVG
ncbi:hypothetical protein BC827DRAFT_624533 [Russula dissimulans]|nr:hypothetical protein BC827DRAFT_624533 [Russula dissimulans]